MWLEKEVSISEIDSLLRDGYEIEVDSPDGWVGVNFFVDKGMYEEYILHTEDGRDIKCNCDHLFETAVGWASAHQLSETRNNVNILDKSGKFVRGWVERTGNMIPIVDINVDHENHRYYTDGVSSHNTGVGKSLFMCHVAASSLAQNYNVLYITLEMAEERIAERIDANLLNVKIDDLLSLPKESFERKIERLKQQIKGKLIIKEYPPVSASSTHFRSLMNELALKRNFKPDILIVDYLNLCASARIKLGANVNSYSFIKAIAEELRSLAVEFKIPVLTATQTTRSGYGSTDPGLEDTSESFGLPATADFMFALIATEELENLNQIMVKQLKNRYNDPTANKRFIVGIDRAKMKLYDAEQSAQKLVDSGQQEEDNGPINRFGDREDSRSKFRSLKV